jgi:hypothetical protein
VISGLSGIDPDKVLVHPKLHGPDLWSDPSGRRTVYRCTLRLYALLGYVTHVYGRL